ncbi:MAG TPA: xanthine dehydrogenase family protein subunit M [Limnochordales bacterium]
MSDFELCEPGSLEEALALLDPQDPSVRVVGGGTALVLMMKQRVFHPTRLVSLRRLAGQLRGIMRGERGLQVGAMTTLRELEQSALVARTAPVLSRALPRLANVRVRNQATLGGHLAHGDPHMDLPPILLAMGARVQATSPRGSRWVPLEELYLGYYETSLARDEVVTWVEIPELPADTRGAYVKFCYLSAEDWPAVGVAVFFRLEGGQFSQVRLAVGACTERPVRISRAETLLNGERPSPAVLEAAAQAAAGEVQPVSDLLGSAEYKREMVRVHVREALEQALVGGGR